jgi:hypothetical protein
LKSDSNCLSTSPIDNLHSQKWFRNHPIRMDMPNQFASKATVFFKLWVRRAESQNGRSNWIELVELLSLADPLTKHMV